MPVKKPAFTNVNLALHISDLLMRANAIIAQGVMKNKQYITHSNIQKSYSVNT